MTLTLAGDGFDQVGVGQWAAITLELYRQRLTLRNQCLQLF
jgi:hypothetical protein